MSADTLSSIASELSSHLKELKENGVVGLPKLPSPHRISLTTVRKELGECTRCSLHSTRKNIVFGSGNTDAALMFVGEAPGESEDAQGIPFVGKAGQLLDKMIGAMGFTRDGVYVANVLKCRPPNNRNPAPEEIEQCRPFLFQQVQAVQPSVIVTLGRPAANLLLNNDDKIGNIRGKFQSLGEAFVMPTFHPAYLLRNPEAKRNVWEDLQLVMKKLDEMGVTRS